MRRRQSWSACSGPVDSMRAATNLSISLRRRGLDVDATGRRIEVNAKFRAPPIERFGAKCEEGRTERRERIATSERISET